MCARYRQRYFTTLPSSLPILKKLVGELCNNEIKVLLPPSSPLPFPLPSSSHSFFRENQPPPECMDSLGSQTKLVPSGLGDDVADGISSQEQSLATDVDSQPSENGSCDQEMGIESELDANLDKNISEKSEALELADVNNIIETNQPASETVAVETVTCDAGGNECEREVQCTNMDDQEQAKLNTTEAHIIEERVESAMIGRDKKSPSPPLGGGEKKKNRRHQPTLLSLFASSNATEQKLKQCSLEKEKSCESTTDDTPGTLVPELTKGQGPSLSNIDDFLLDRDDGLTVEVPINLAKPLTPMERFQQRLMKHMSTSTQPTRNEKRSSSKEKEEGAEKGVTELIPDDLMTKLKDKPGKLCKGKSAYSFENQSQTWKIFAHLYPYTHKYGFMRVFIMHPH